MGAVEHVELPIVDSCGHSRAKLCVRLLPNNKREPIEPLLDLSNSDEDRDLEPIQLLEGAEYVYEVLGTFPQISSDCGSIFVADDLNGFRGRIRPGLHTGTLCVKWNSGNDFLGSTSFEVRSLKLDYQTDYRWMLRDIAEALAELVMEGFAPTTQAFQVDASAGAHTLYQKFAFLKSLLMDQSFQQATEQILHAPYSAWEIVSEERDPTRGIRASSAVYKELRRPGSRRVPTIRSDGIVHALPKKVRAQRHSATIDNPENRFVKYVLLSWREFVFLIQDSLAAESQRTSLIVRGLKETQDVLDHLDSILNRAIFKEIGELHSLPSNSQVLQRRAGYREYFRSFLLFEAASRLDWTGANDVYEAGQRNVAVLYEFWVYLKIAELIAKICGIRPTLSSLVEPGERSVKLSRGQSARIHGNLMRSGRELEISLFFNKEFSSNEHTWSINLRPDCSLKIADNLAPEQCAWIHFDAKYRVQMVGKNLFNEASQVRGETKEADLAKMHAYKDAIRQSAGAYVVFPGDRGESFREYHEILPGLGAFSLRPAYDGEPQGVCQIESFINQAIDHVASQATQHARGLYWEKVSYSGEMPRVAHWRYAPFLKHPPADTLVLAGFVRAQWHLEWIENNRLYNLRADARTGSVQLGAKELAAEFCLLYGPEIAQARLFELVGVPRLYSGEELFGMGYREPRGDKYYCLSLGIEHGSGLLEGVSSEGLEGLKRRLGVSSVVGAPWVVNFNSLWPDC